MRDIMISCGVNSMKKFGYRKVNKSNILTDRVYSQVFDVILEGWEGRYEEPVVSQNASLLRLEIKSINAGKEDPK